MFRTVFFIGIAVAFSTVFGSLLAFCIKDISHKFNDGVMSLTAGVMLGATIFNLIIPSIENENSSIFITATGLLLGALFINLLDKFIPHVHTHFGGTALQDNGKVTKVILFVMAIAIHNFPEGMVVGISLGANDMKSAIILAVGIALQNIPEGLITIFPLLNAGFSKKKAFTIAFATGLIELLGVIVGYLTINISLLLLPFLLAFAGGTMLYVINHDMITETHSHGYETIATYMLIIGFIMMLALNYFFI